MSKATKLLRTAWWHRPVLTTNSRIANEITDATIAAFGRGMDSAKPSRITPRGNTLQLRSGGAA